MKIADLRQEYMRSGLSEAQADPDPIRQFERWFEDAVSAGLPLPNAMTLATVTPSGAPSARIVLLKGVERGGFLFYTNYLSRKGRELERRASACLLFLWSEVERQVRKSAAACLLSGRIGDEFELTPVILGGPGDDNQGNARPGMAEDFECGIRVEGAKATVTENDIGRKVANPGHESVARIHAMRRNLVPRLLEPRQHLLRGHAELGAAIARDLVRRDGGTGRGQCQRREQPPERRRVGLVFQRPKTLLI